jgi:hypothetical protein
MKRLIPAMLLLATLNAQAEFVQYHEDDEMQSYLDAAGITRAGREVRMWTIDDYRKPQTDIGDKPYRSVRSHWTFDCAKRMSDVLTAFYYAEAMAQGATVHFGSPTERQWDKVVPGTVGELTFKVACAKPAAAKSPAAKPAEKPRTP